MILLYTLPRLIHRLLQHLLQLLSAWIALKDAIPLMNAAMVCGVMGGA